MKPRLRSASLSLLGLVALAVAAEPPEKARSRFPDRPRERAEWNAAFRLDGAGQVSSENRLKALRHTCEMPVDPSMAAAPAGTFTRSDAGPSALAGTFGGVAWESLGPKPMVSGYGGLGAVSGRTTAIAIHPTNPQVVLVGAATGGIWKSTDGGTSFRPVSDSAPAIATSHITFAPSNPAIVFAATGELDSAYLECRPARSFGTYLGAGLLRSVDGGESWTRVDVNLPGNSVVSRVLVHPTNPQLVLAGVYLTQSPVENRSSVGGLYRSTDGGVHFEKTFSHSVSDLVRDPDGGDGVWAGFGITVDPNGNCRRAEVDGGVYRSTDFGQTWKPSLVESDEADARLPKPIGQVKVTVSKGSVYASILDRSDSHSGAGVFRTTDGGESWDRMAAHPDMCGEQCDYNHFILADPDSENVVYFGGVDLFKSTDGARSWRHLTDFYLSDTNVHPDQHAAAIVPGAGTLYVANDGGLYRSTDKGQTFTGLNDTLVTAQFNGIALHPTDPAFAMGGTQDNGNLRFKGSAVWSDRTTGDGGFNLIKRDDPRRILAANYYASLNLSTDGGESFLDATNCDSLMNCISGNFRETMAFYPPAAAAPGKPELVFLGTQRLWVHPAFGANRSLWEARSGKITSSVLTAVAPVGDGAVVWAGSRTGEVFFSTDGGVTMTPRSAGIPATAVSAIKAVSADGRAAYLTVGGYNGTPPKHVFLTNDAGVTWTNISGNLPDVPVSSLAIDPGDPTDLFAGTDVGVFRSTDGGGSWKTFNQGLPNATVNALAFHPVSGDLWAATYGRGVFRIAASAATVAPTADFSFSPDDPAPDQGVFFTDRSTGSPTAFAWDFGDGSPPSDEKSPNHAYAQAGRYAVRLTVSSPAGSSSKSAFVNVTAGIPDAVELQVPVVLDVFGVPPTHYTSDLVAVNRGARTRLSLHYTPATGTPGAGGPVLAEALEKGRELRIPDVIAYLRARGTSIPAGGSAAVGTLRLRFEDQSDASLVFAGSRTATPNPNTAVGGSFGLFASAVAVDAAPATSVSLFGLREDAAARTNLAVVDVPGAGGPAKLSIQVYDGDLGLPAGAPIDVALRAGDWYQIGSILGSVATRSGYAEITNTGGGRFLAYGVVNDGPSSGGGTSDGSFLQADAAATSAPGGLLPIVLRATSGSTVFTSELTLANPTTSVVNVTISYTPSPQLGSTGGMSSATISVGPRRQLRIPDVVAYLRDTLGLPLLPGNVNQGGTLQVTGAVAQVRTSNPNPDGAVGGAFGLAYPAVPSAARAKSEAWVYGLLQNADTRSNLAIADARVGDAASVTYVVEVYDSLSGDGTAPKATQTVTLTGGQWYQVSRVLDAAGVSNGYVRVRPQSGTSDFVAYGILNDGANPGDRTSDGSYIGMSGVR